MRALAPLLLLCGTVLAGAAEFDEAQAVARGLEHPGFLRRQLALENEAAALVGAAGRWSNPALELSRETASVPGGDSEDRFLWIRQRLDLAGVNAAERDAARATETARRARLEYARRERVATIRRLFYQSLAARAHHVAVSEWQARLRELETAVSQRVTAGDASRYDLLRLQRELSRLDGEAEEARADAQAARQQLLGVIGGEDGEPGGELMPPSPEPTELAQTLDRHPLIRALGAERDSASLDARVAERRAWPEIDVGLGHRQLSQPGWDGDGNLIALQLEIPLFDRHQQQARAATSRAAGLDADLTLMRQRLSAEARASHSLLQARREAALQLRGDDEESAATELTRLAESAYLAGELGVMELIDAHRSELATRREVIARTHRARQAFIDWQLILEESP